MGAGCLSKAAWSYLNWVNSELSRPISCCAEFRAANTRAIPIPAPIKTMSSPITRICRFKQGAFAGQGASHSPEFTVGSNFTRGIQTGPSVHAIQPVRNACVVYQRKPLVHGSRDMLGTAEGLSGRPWSSSPSIF